MSASDPDTSESSNLEPPFSQSDSPYSSPSQQVPQLANFLTVLSCADTLSINNGGKQPYLRIVEQPQNHFRFRYRSEMLGTHGCLLGKNSGSNKTKTHPAVELVNYSGQARIRCRLAQHNNSDEHPHKLLEDDQDRDVSAKVPEHGSYKVGFPGMGIIHTAKKDVPQLLFKKYESKMKNASDYERALRSHCENIAKNINLNIVRLRFSAHDILTDKEICPPIFSEPIHNMKSAATNDLKICRMSKCIGRPKGGDDVFIFVEKVNKKNIQVRFYELSESGEECWSANARFDHTDVHHQYGIVFRTPPYPNQQIASDVKVLVELLRPSDGRTSEPREFTYKAEYVNSMAKKRKANSSYSSLNSNSGGSINSLSDLPVPLQIMHHKNELLSDDEVMKDLSSFSIPVPQPVAPASNDLLMAEAILYNESACTPNQNIGQHFNMNLMLGQPSIPEPPVLHFNSSEIERLLKHNSNISIEEKKQFCEADWTEYFKSYGDSVTDGMSGMEFIRLVPDSARPRTKENVHEPKPSPISSEEDHVKTNIINKKNHEYTAFYSTKDGIEVKQIVKELCEMIKNKTVHKKQVVKSKLERLFEMRLSNGDTFLHMVLTCNQTSLEYIVKLIHSMKLTHLLNKTNNQAQSILHLAVIHDQPKLVTFLVSKGCNPMIEDNEGNNAIHYAVICQICLVPLLEAIKTYDVNFDINAYNNDKHTALHLAAIYGSEESTRILLSNGASLQARDSEGRTALHLAAYDDCAPVVRAIVDVAELSDIDAVDGRGNTALQIVCGRAMEQNSVEIVKLLLDKNASPYKHEGNNQPSWRLARDKPELYQIIQKYLTPQMLCEDEIKSEPEDEMESADEGEGEAHDRSLEQLSLFLEEVSKVLDNTGAWRELAERLNRDSLLSWYSASKSPTRTLLTHLKECDDDITPKSLALLLEDMGQKEAANIIRRYIS
ncbi:nuclear factor NF-kappa-B p110 subunit-like [Battus philenor]|uniref:nuclear factor NF-kappa-B p110 subunit-like n=1 Tax=Battus philenor TaxID=42288 RepID=UPI0035D01465